MTDAIRCDTCRYWVRGWRADSGQQNGSVGYSWNLPDPNYPRGECRRHPPQPAYGFWTFGRTTEADWCGEHEPKERA